MRLAPLLLAAPLLITACDDSVLEIPDAAAPDASNDAAPGDAAPQTEPAVFATDLGCADNLRVQAGYLYWTQHGPGTSIRRSPLDRFDPETLYQSEDSVEDYAVGTGHVYFTSGQGHLSRVPLGGGFAEPVADNIYSGVAVAAGRAFVTTYTSDGNAIVEVADDGTLRPFLQVPDGAGALRGDDVRLAWLGYHESSLYIETRTVAGGTERMRQIDQQPEIFRLGGHTVYWTTQDPSGETILQGESLLTSDTLYQSISHPPRDAYPVGDWLYVSDESTVWRIPRFGSDAEPEVITQSGGGGSLAGDDRTVFWTDGAPYCGSTISYWRL